MELIDEAQARTMMAMFQMTDIEIKGKKAKMNDKVLLRPDVPVTPASRASALYRQESLAWRRGRRIPDSSDL